MQLNTQDFVQRTIYLSGAWDDDVGRVVRRLQPGQLFIDCGANVGYFSLMAAARGARVIAFEPNPACVREILVNARLNELPGIDVRCMGLGATSGQAELTLTNDSNLGAASLKPGHGKALTVALDSLDAQLEGLEPDLIKLDIEGAEILALQGARRILAGPSAPAVLCEVSEYSLRQMGGSKDELFALMSAHGYRHRVVSKVRQSSACRTSVYFQYDVLFEK